MVQGAERYEHAETEEPRLVEEQVPRDQLAFVDRQREGLFAIHVLARFERGDVDERMPMIRRADDRNVRLLALQQLNAHDVAFAIGLQRGCHVCILSTRIQCKKRIPVIGVDRGSQVYRFAPFLPAFIETFGHPDVVVANAAGAVTSVAWIGQVLFLIGTGALLCLAWASRLVLPAGSAHWAFIMATLIGLVPVARRAFAMTRAGIPFTIEMLMTIAAAPSASATWAARWAEPPKP